MAVDRATMRLVNGLFFTASFSAALFVLSCLLLQPFGCGAQPPPNYFLMTSSASSNEDRQIQGFSSSNRTRHRSTGRPVRFSAVEMAPYLTRSSRGGATGFIADIVDSVSRQMDVDYRWYVEKAAGKRRKNRGNLSEGLVVKLLNHDFDIGVIALGHGQTNDRRLLLNHQPITETSLSLLVNPTAYLTRRDQGQGPLVDGNHFYLEDLLNDTTIGLGFIAHSRVHHLLRRSELPVHQAVWNRLSATAASNRSSVQRHSSTSSSNFPLDVVFPSLASGVQYVVDNTRFVLIVESADAVSSTLRPPGCGLSVQDQYFPVTQFYFVVPRTTGATTATGAPHNGDHDDDEGPTLDPKLVLRRIDAALSKLHDNGVIRRLHEKWLTTNRGCIEPTVFSEGISTPSSPNAPHSYVTDRRAPPQSLSDSDWRARERIFFESPLRHQTVTKFTSTTVSTTVLMTIENENNTLSSADVQPDDVIELATQPDVDLKPFDDTMTTPMTSDAHASLNHSGSDEESLSTSGYLEKTDATISIPSKPVMTSTLTTRRRHKLQTDVTSGPLDFAPPTTIAAAEASYDVIVAIDMLLDNADESRGPEIDDDIDPGGETEQEMAVRDHWRRHQATASETSPPLNAQNDERGQQHKSFNGTEILTGSTSRQRWAWTYCVGGVLVANLLRTRLT